LWYISCYLISHYYHDYTFFYLHSSATIKYTEFEDNWEIAFYLLAAGADINVKTCEGIQPIHFIARATPEKKTLMER
jgi:hypothetical protein